MSGLLAPAVLVLALTLPLVLPWAASATAETRPRITTDTTEYCGVLAARLAGLPAAELEPSRSLGAEGVRLCGNGHVRTGVAKLRRALRAAQASPEYLPLAASP